MYLTDNKQREIKEMYGSYLLVEPEIYPTYLVYPKEYKTGQEIEHQGVYIPPHPYANFSLYGFQYDEFYETLVQDNYISSKTKENLTVEGDIEYGLYDSYSPYCTPPEILEDENTRLTSLGSSSSWAKSEFYYVKEIPPNTEGIPNNPLRLEHLRYPLKKNEHFPTIAELQAKSGFVYQHPHYKVETYNQVVNRYERFYSHYLLENGVDEALLKDYTEP